MKDLFLLDPSVTYLNHGSFGACPKPIFDDYQNWQLKLEHNPVEFITKIGPESLKTSRNALANYINCNADDLVYMTNPSTAMNAVIKSLDLKEGDEILTTNQEYGAMDRTWRYYCQKTGAKYIHQNITLPLVSKEVFINEFWAGLTPKTKVIFISQITSTTALIFPVQEICDRARELGLIIIVDGAHVPAHIPLDIQKLNPDAYTGACHKWMLAPKGSSFLYVKKELQRQIDPLIISWGYEAEQPSESQFLDYHEYQGTRDFSAFLTTPAALQFLDDNDWDDRSKECRKILKNYYPELAMTLNSQVLSPLTDEFLGQICSIPIVTPHPQVLKNTLLERFKIEVPIMNNATNTYIRVSFQAYNGTKEIEKLLDALKKLKNTTNLLSN